MLCTSAYVKTNISEKDIINPQEYCNLQRTRAYQVEFMYVYSQMNKD